MGRAAESMNWRKMEWLMGSQTQVTLTTDPVSLRWNLHNGNHRRTCAIKLNLMQLPVRDLWFSFWLANNYIKVPMVRESRSNLSFLCKFRFITFRNQERWNYSFYSESIMFIHAVKYRQFRLKGKTIIIEKFSLLPYFLW